MPRVLNYSVTKSIPHNAVYCGRAMPKFGLCASPFANPFKEGPWDARGSHRKFEAWLMSKPELLATLEELHGRDLVCWCAPEPCHCDVLLRLANPAQPPRP